eukprot:scaffold2090_cov225-Prasinococcus_capsulatus_cf.AAC.53
MQACPCQRVERTVTGTFKVAQPNVVITSTSLEESNSRGDIDIGEATEDALKVLGCYVGLELRPSGHTFSNAKTASAPDSAADKHTRCLLRNELLNCSSLAAARDARL